MGYCWPYNGYIKAEMDQHYSISAMFAGLELNVHQSIGLLLMLLVRRSGWPNWLDPGPLFCWLILVVGSEWVRSQH